MTDSHHSTLHAFFLAAKESGYTEFALRLLTSPKGRVEFCMSPREHPEIGAKFEVRGNMTSCSRQRCERRPCRRDGFWSLWRHAVRGGTRSGSTVPIGLHQACAIRLYQRHRSRDGGQCRRPSLVGLQGLRSRCRSRPLGRSQEFDASMSARRVRGSLVVHADRLGLQQRCLSQWLHACRFRADSIPQTPLLLARG